MSPGTLSDNSTPYDESSTVLTLSWEPSEADDEAHAQAFVRSKTLRPPVGWRNPLQDPLARLYAWVMAEERIT